MATLIKRLELLVDHETDKAIDELAKELAGNGDPRMHRSRAARELLMDAIDRRRKRAARRSARAAA